MKKFLLYLFVSSLPFGISAQLTVSNLKCENLTNPIGLGEMTPGLSWQMLSDKRNMAQTAYEIKVSARPVKKGFIEDEIWGSGKVISNQSVQVSYGGKPLIANHKYFWQVRVWDNNNNPSLWSEPAFFQMGLPKPSDWQAQWIQVLAEDNVQRPAQLFRHTFIQNKKVASATAYITAQGMYEAFINGKRIGDAYFTPGWTSYNKRLQYQAYNVTHLLQSANNTVGAMLGSGWYRGNLAWGGNKDSYGKTLALLLQINITFTDGTTAIVGTNGDWKTSVGDVQSSEIYHGETIDARKEQRDWHTTTFNDNDWQKAVTVNHDKNRLVSTVNEPVKKHETFTTLKILVTPAGDQVIDFGQNLVGFVKVTAKGNAGQKITLHHAEVLDKQGNFYTDNLRAAQQQNNYILAGKGVETFEPHFSWQGFRYVKVTGYPGPLLPENFTAVALYSDMAATGSFSTSNQLINQLQHNIEWGQKGNFIDVPTDCPQRDERLGWTGDAQVFSRTAAFNMGVQNFFLKWMQDVAADQLPNGSVPFVVPNVLGENSTGSAGWADAATIIPWNMYLAYGDKKILKQQYASMKAWVDFMKTKSAQNLWNTGFHFGDWLFYRPGDDNDGRSAITDKYLIAQCFFAHSTQLLINTATILNHADDAALYTQQLADIKKAFLTEYITASGRLVSGSQTAYVLALNFDMLPEKMRALAAERLVENVKSYNGHLTTGFLGTPYLCHVLTRFGYADVAFKLLLQETYPSWLYPVKMGATTIWERWDGQKPDSTFQTPGMNSFNHYAYGAIGDWMYREVAGIDTYTEAPGYKKIRIKPLIGGNFSYVKASLKTAYGKVTSAWKILGDTMVMEVEIPANTTANIYLPTANQGNIKEGGALYVSRPGLVNKGREDNYVVLEAGSGSYRFTIDKQAAKQVAVLAILPQ